MNDDGLWNRVVVAVNSPSASSSNLSDKSGSSDEKRGMMLFSSMITDGCWDERSLEGNPVYMVLRGDIGLGMR